MRSRMPKTREAVAARATRPHVSPTTLPDAFAHLQHAAGNRAVAEMIVRAGVVKGQAPPDGLNAVQARSAGAAGYTGVKNSAAFVNLDLTTSIDRSSSKPGQAYVTVDQPQDSPDAVHEALYLLPGDHRHGTRTYTDKGRTYTPYTRVDNDTSDLIRAGEQEHLDDARRAYDLSYGLILATVRAMAGAASGLRRPVRRRRTRSRRVRQAVAPGSEREPAGSSGRLDHRARRVAETDQGPRREGLAQPRQRQDGHRGRQVGVSAGADGHDEDRLGRQ
jgi:hypothetical protein